jgi:hypothetical protein
MNGAPKPPQAGIASYYNAKGDVLNLTSSVQPRVYNHPGAYGATPPESTDLNPAL